MKAEKSLPERATNRGWLGVGLESLNVEEQKEYKLDYPAVRVRKVFRNSPAAKAGVQKGDLIFRVGSSDIRNGVKEMVAHVQSHEQGSTVRFLLGRDQQEISIEVVLDPFPNQRNLLENEWKNLSFPESTFQNLKHSSEVTIQQEKGKIVILDYWATWCGPCRAAAPELEELRTQYPESVLTIIGVSAEDKSVVEAYERNNPATYPIWLDTNKVINDVIGAGSLPTFMLIDRDGKIQRIVVGMKGVKEMAKEVKNLVSVNDS